MTIVASSLTSWLTAKHYYLADVENKFLNVKVDIKELKTDINNKFDKIDKKYEKIE